nr:hypothetical protein [Tanacetum cinerariifolium]
MPILSGKILCIKWNTNVKRRATKYTTPDSLKDDVLFTTIKVVSRHQTTQQYGVILPIELTNDDIRNNKAYKEYYACATGEAAPKPKVSARKKTGGFASSTTPPTPIATLTPTTTVVAAPRLSATAKDEGTGSRPGVPNVPSDDSEEELSWNSFDDEDVDEQTKGREESEGDKTDESDDDDDEEVTTKIGEKEVAESDEGDDEATESDRESKDEETREQEEESFDPIPRTPEDDEYDDNNEEDQGLRIGDEERMQEEEDAEELYRDVDINQGQGLQVSQETEDTHVILTPTQSDAQQESSSTSSFMTNLLNPIIDPVQTQTTQLQDSIQRENDEFLKTIDENIKKIIKEQVKSQVKAQVTRILPRIDEAVNAQLEAEALVEAYDADKTILDTYGESTILKRRREDDDQEGPFAGSDRGSKRRREGGEHASASIPSEQATKSAGRSTTGSQSRQLSASESAFAEEPVQPTCQMVGPSHPVFETGQQYPHNLMQPLPLISDHRGRSEIPFKHFINKDLEYLRGGASSRKYTISITKTKAADYGHIKWIEDLVPRAMWIQEPISYDKHALWGVSHWGRKRQQFYGFAVNRESALDVYSKRRIIVVTKLKIVEWRNYKHLDWISVHRDDDKIYKFKEGDLKRLRIQDIEDMLLLLVQGKLSNLTVEERFAFNVSLRMFTRSIVI